MCSLAEWSVKDLPQYACCKEKLDCFVWVDLHSVAGVCVPWIGGVCVDCVWTDWSWEASVWVDWSQVKPADVCCALWGLSWWEKLAGEVAGEIDWFLVFRVFFLCFDPADLFSRCSGRCCEDDDCSTLTWEHSLAVFIWDVALCLFFCFFFFFFPVFPWTLVSTRPNAVSLQSTGGSPEQAWLFKKKHNVNCFAYTFSLLKTKHCSSIIFMMTKVAWHLTKITV